MTAILINEAKRFRQSALVLIGAFGITIAFFLAVFPAMSDEADMIEEAFPEFMMGVMGFEEIHTIEGFTAGYVYTFLWILFAGIYFGYLGGGLIAEEIETGKMDLTLANPVSRESVLAQKVAALAVPLLLLNVGMMILVYVGSALVGESYDFLGLLMVHLLGLPYLLVCAGIGVVLSVVLDRSGTAQAGAIGAVFVLWLVDGLSGMEESYEPIGDLTPSRYFDPSGILVHEEYAFDDASVLLVGFLGLVGLAMYLFVRRDV